MAQGYPSVLFMWTINTFTLQQSKMLVDTSGANRAFVFLDPNFFTIANWDLVGISLIFREIIERRGRQ